MNDTEKLLPCPFCGGEAETYEEHTDNGGAELYYREYHSYIVRCKKCGASIVNCWGGMEQVIKQWNQRFKESEEPT